MTGKKTDNGNSNKTDSNSAQESGEKSQKLMEQRSMSASGVEDPKKSSGKEQTPTTKNTPEKSSKVNSPTINKQPPVRTKKSGGLWIGIVLLIFVAGLGASAYFAWQFWQVQDVRLQSLESQVAEQLTVLSSLPKQEAQQQQTFEALQASLNDSQRAVQQRLDAHAQRLNTLTGTNSDDWMLSETRYLLRLANQRRLIGGDSSGVVDLLTAADNVLLAVDRPNLFPIREAINREIVSLKLLPKIDKEGIYLQLSALISQIDQLPPVPLERIPEPPKETTEQEEDKKINLWRSIVEALGRMDRYIRIDSYDTPQQPLLSAERRRLLQLKLHIVLEQAQLALLREETTIYQQSLAQAITWLDTHYQHFAEKQALVDELIHLQQQQMAYDLPDISQSLILLTHYIEGAQELSPKEAKSPTEKRPDTEVVEEKEGDL